MKTAEQRLKDLATLLRQRERTERKKEHDAKLNAETYGEAAGMAELELAELATTKPVAIVRGDNNGRA